MYKDLNEKDACGVGFVANRFGSRSHEIIKMATQAVTNLTHRGAVAADAKTGDGAGILTQIPEKLFQKELEKLGVHLNSINDMGVGMIFLPRHDEKALAQGRALVEKTLQQYGVPLLGWRSVPSGSFCSRHQGFRDIAGNSTGTGRATRATDRRCF